MQYQTFSDQISDTYPICFLVPKLEKVGMLKEYINENGLKPEEALAYQTPMNGKKSPPVSEIKEYYDELFPILQDLGVEYVLISDAAFFKTLAGVNKAPAYAGYVLPNAYPKDKAGVLNVIYVPNYRQVFYDPTATRQKIKGAFEAMWNHRLGTYKEPGHELLHYAAYPTSPTDIGAWLAKLLDMDADLTADIEGFSLKHHSAGIGTISFAWSQHEGIAFPVDLGPNGKAVRRMLKDFFMKFERRMIWHNISYDVYVLVYQLFMDDLLDTEGLLTGLEIMLRNWEDTKLITYLATNSCAGNELGLKVQAQEFAGNYAVEDIKDITKIPLPQLLEYNLVDACSTWYTYHKHWNTMIQDQQYEIYTELFKSAIVDIIQMQLTGMPVNMHQVKKAKVILEDDRNDALNRISKLTLVREYTAKINEKKEAQRYQDWLDRKNNGVKVRPYKPGDFDTEFNPNSGPQLQELLFEELGLPVLELTDTKLPATGGDVLKKLKVETQDPFILSLLEALIDFKEVDKIFSTFIPVLENAVKAKDGAYYVFGNFNLGGTVSGRLSSSDPNLQNLPSTGNKYAKLIKDCFRAPKGYLMIGLDFASLEDRISALTTKDPNKLKVYTDGFDGHCLRAHSYFGEQMSNNIDPNDPESINSIKDLHPELRQRSKTPTFALTYQGTYITLMGQGFSKEEARTIEARYHELYKVSDDWVDEKLEEASKTGYITAAFGLRVRTPLLHQVIRGTSKTPWEAQAEGRTAGNALGQSWCLLNTRASVEFMQTVRASKHRLDIRPIAHIHDAQYFLIPDDIETLLFVNEHLVRAVQWQAHPDIAHDQVKLGGELSVFYPSWAHEAELPNGASEETVYDLITEHLNKLKKKGIPV